MTPHQFTVKAQSVGLSLRGISIKLARVLATMVDTPITVTFTKDASMQMKASTSAPCAIGPLFTHSLAKMNESRTAYEITTKGRGYIASLQAANLLP